MIRITKKEKTPPLEELNSFGEGIGLEAERYREADNDTIEPFDPEKIDVITQGRTIDLLLTRLNEEELDLSPDFQRRGNLWNETRKTSLIESILLRIPIPSLYVSENKDGDYAVVDGLQRLCAIAHFVDVAALNKAAKSTLAPLRLKGLQSLKEYEGKSFAEIPRNLQRRIRETELTLHVIRASTPPKVMFNIFYRINQGGLPATAQEIRNAIFPGEWRSQIRVMAESESFKTATENKIKGERMEDLELVLRFVALYSYQEERPKEQNLDIFLNEAVEKRFKDWNAQNWKQINLAFERALTAAPKIFGNLAFRKYSPDRRPPINRGLFETETVALASRTEKELQKLAVKQKEIISKLAPSSDNQSFYSALLYATGRGESSNIRLQFINKVFDEALKNA